MFDLSISHVLPSCLAATVLLACSDPAPDPGGGVDAMASALADAAAGNAADAAPPDGPDPALALRGQWRQTLMIGPTTDAFAMLLQPAGVARVDRIRRDQFGEFINCVTVERVDASWSADATRLTLTPTAGTIERRDELGGLDCAAEDLVPMRVMTPDEVVAHDFFSGDYVLTADRLEVTTRNALRFGWTRD